MLCCAMLYCQLAASRGGLEDCLKTAPTKATWRCLHIGHAQVVVL